MLFSPWDKHNIFLVVLVSTEIVNETKIKHIFIKISSYPLVVKSN